MAIPKQIMDGKWQSTGRPDDKVLRVLEIGDYCLSARGPVLIQYFLRNGNLHVRLVECTTKDSPIMGLELVYLYDKECPWVFGDERVRGDVFRDFADSIGIIPFGLAELIINGAYPLEEL